MSKGMITKKSSKKEPTKTLKEKRAAKRLEKEEKESLAGAFKPPVTIKISTLMM